MNYWVMTSKEIKKELILEASRYSGVPQKQLEAVFDSKENYYVRRKDGRSLQVLETTMSKLRAPGW